MNYEQGPTSAFLIEAPGLMIELDFLSSFLIPDRSCHQDKIRPRLLPGHQQRRGSGGRTQRNRPFSLNRGALPSWNEAVDRTAFAAATAISMSLLGTHLQWLRGTVPYGNLQAENVQCQQTDLTSFE